MQPYVLVSPEINLLCNLPLINLSKLLYLETQPEQGARGKAAALLMSINPWHTGAFKQPAGC